MAEEPALKPLREAFEQVRDRLDSIIARLRAREEIRLPALALHRLRPHEKLHPSDARPRRPALPEMQRSRLSSGAVTQASSLFGRAGFHPAMSGLNRESRKAGKQETAGLAYGCVTQR
jgi:hypothetical protein